MLEFLPFCAIFCLYVPFSAIPSKFRRLLSVNSGDNCQKILEITQKVDITFWLTIEAMMGINTAYFALAPAKL